MIIFVSDLKGNVYRLYSDNKEEKTMDLVPECEWISQTGQYDPDLMTTVNLPYSEIAMWSYSLYQVRETNQIISD